MKKRILFLF